MGEEIWVKLLQPAGNCHWSLMTIHISDWLVTFISIDLNCVSPLLRFKSKKGGDSGNLATKMVQRFPFI